MISTAPHPYNLQANDLSLDEPYVLRVRDMAEPDRPREKMQTSGPSALNINELLAIIWGSGTKKEEVLSMAQRTLQDYGEKSIANLTNPQQLADTVDIPYVRACQLVASLELGRRLYATKNGRPVSVRTPKQAYQHLKSIGLSSKEQLRGLYLNSRYHVIHDEVISIGTLTSNLIHPREVFQPAIEHGAVAIIIAHNHPSGVLEPTEADITVTQQLIAAGKLLGIDVIDHLVITSSKYLSIVNGLNL